MEAYQETLLSLLGKQLFHTQYTPPADTDWCAVFQEARSQCVDPLVFEAAAGHISDPEVAAVWHRCALTALRRTVTVFRAHEEIHRLMTGAGIPYVILKGCSSASYYEKPSLRVMGDVDFLVDPANVSQAGQLLTESGYVGHDNGHAYHIHYQRGKEVAELHWAVTRLSEIATQDVIKPMLDEFIPEARSVKLADCSGSLMLPSEFHHGLNITLHTAKHLTHGDGVGLRHLCDLAVFYNHFDDAQFVAMFRSRFQSAGLWRFTQLMAHVCHLYLQMPCHSWMGEANAQAAEKVITDILTGGNFGHRNNLDQTDQSVKSLTADVNRGHMAQSNFAKLVQFLRNCNSAGKSTFPIMDRPVLKHLAWIPLGFKYSFLCIAGKRKMFRLKNILEGSDMREHLYLQLLYQNEAEE